MGSSAPSLETLLADINSGRAEQALPELDTLLASQPGHPGLLTLRAEALRLTGRLDAAVEAFKQAANSGGGSRSWLTAGVLLANQRDTQEAVQCLLRALAETPDSEEVLDALITTFFNSNRHGEGIEYARKQLLLSTNPTFMARAALLLHAVDLYEEATAALRHVISLAPDDTALVGSALVPARFTCDWDWIELLQQKITDCYARGDFAAPQEYPLTNLTWCADEACNLGVTRAYVARMVGKAEVSVAPPPGPAGPRIRIGYLSCDFRNHATMHLMAGLLEAHDRRRFEVFAYDYSNHDASEYRQRFLNAVEHHIPIHSLTDAQAARRIAEDRLDILFDLKLYTGGGRAGVMAYRPAPVQVAYLGFPGSAASSWIDYMVSDRFVTPDSSAPHYTEKFCRLPHSYQCNDRQRFVAAAPATRADYGLADDKVVFGAFNQSYKVDRGSFAVWMRILQAVPDSVLWLLGQSASAVANLTRHAQLQGIDPTRLIFAPFAHPIAHLARLPLADAVLDALVCNGHTTTSDALWAGVPVVSVRGKHFASRVSESLLNGMLLPELVGADPDDMVRIATRIGTDASYRAQLRAKIAVNRLSAPLFDTARYARNFERGIELMVQRYREGLPVAHIDVPDQPAVEAAAPAPAFIGRVDALRVAYAGCPLCDGSSESLGFANCTTHVLWHEPLPTSIEWQRCSNCGHLHSRYFWNEAGCAEVARNVRANLPSNLPAALESRRAAWTPVVEKVLTLLGGYRAVSKRPDKPVWVDVGTGDGSQVMAALDYGFAAVGLDTRPELVRPIKELGFNAMQNDFLTLRFDLTPDVVSMHDFLTQIPHPREALHKAAAVLPAGGVLVVSTPDLSSAAWKLIEAAPANPYLMDLERFHVFSRERLIALLADTGFDTVDITARGHEKAQIELYAVRRDGP